MRRLWPLPCLLLLFVGCGGPPEAGPPQPSVSRTTAVADRTASASPSVDPSAETAEQFIRRFTAADTTMQNTGDTAGYLSLTANCSSCQATADRIKAIYGAGGAVHYSGARVVWVKKMGLALWRYKVIAGRTTYRESSKGRMRHLDGGPFTLRVSLDKEPGRWLVTSAVVES